MAGAQIYNLGTTLVIPHVGFLNFVL